MTSASAKAHVPHNPFLEKYGPYALVTGASSGIGAEFARQLSVIGLNLILVARRLENLKELAAQITNSCKVDVKCIRADLSCPEKVEEVIHACQELHVGLLVNNAGVQLNGSFFHPQFAQHRNCLAVNVVAPTHLAYAFARKLVERKRGGIIFVSSVSSGGMPWFATYSSSKAYLSTLALTLGDELRRYGIDVLCLEPGLVASEMTLNPGQVDHSYGYFLMDTADCVKQAIDALGNKSMCTPGLLNRINKFLYHSFPRVLGTYWLGNLYRRILPQQNFEFSDSDD